MLQDHDQKTILVTYGPLRTYNAIKGIAISLLMGLRELHCLQVNGCEAKGDSEVVISWGLGNSSGSWELAPVIYEIREIISSLSISLSHIDRSQNELADKLANSGVNSLMVVVENFLPAD